MTGNKRTKPRVFIDADVLFSGSASSSEDGASLVILKLAEITLVEAYTSEQVIQEVERNLLKKLPLKLNTFRALANRCLEIMPSPSADMLAHYPGLADPKDLPILVAALQNACTYLVTHNVRDFQRGHPDIIILKPGEFILRVRDILSLM